MAAFSSCVKQDEVYAPPHQRRPLAGPDTSRLKHFVAMNDPDAPAHFLRDINGRLEGGLWRWTAQHPRLRLVLPPNPGRLKLQIEFTIPSGVLEQTGPLTVKFFLNQRDLETVTLTQPGEHRREWPVDPAWLAAEDNVLGADLSKVFVGEDGAQLGLALVRAGFVN